MLSLAGNRLTDISALLKLKKIEYLRLSKNQITNLEPLSDIKTIIELLLADNPITDISPLKNLKVDVDYDGEAVIDLTNLDIDAKLAEEMFGKYLHI